MQTKLINTSLIVVPEGYVTVRHRKNTCEAIRITGVMAPIIVRQEGERYIIVDGYERLMCAKELGWQEVPAVVVESSTPLLSFALNYVRGQYSGVDVLTFMWQFLQQYDRSTVVKILGRSYDTIRKYQDAYERMLALNLSKDDWQRLRTDGIGVKKLIQCAFDSHDREEFMSCVYGEKRRPKGKTVTPEAIRKAIALEKNEELKSAVDIVETYGPQNARKAIELYMLLQMELCPKLKDVMHCLPSITYNILAQYCGHE